MTLQIESAAIADHVDIDAALKMLVETSTAETKRLSHDLKALNEVVAKLEVKMGRPGWAGEKATGPAALAAETKALGKFVTTGNDTELKALSVGSDVDGGYTVTPELSMQMTKRRFDQSPMRRICRVVTIGAGDSFEEPLDFGDVGATWVGETEARPSTSTPQIGLLNVPCNEIYALQPVTQRLLDDSRFDIGAWISEKIADKFARTEGTAFVSGNGVNRPKGFLTYSTDTAVDITRDPLKLQHVVSGGATTVTADGLRDLFWAVRAPHRANGTWVMSSATANAVDKLKNGTGDYIWRDSSAAGLPPTLLGKPVEFVEDMPAIGSNTFPIAFGDWKVGYMIVEKLGLRLLRDIFTSKPNVLFYAYTRVGGAVASTDAIKLQKVST